MQGGLTTGILRRISIIIDRNIDLGWGIEQLPGCTNSSVAILLMDVHGSLQAYGGGATLITP